MTIIRNIGGFEQAIDLTPEELRQAWNCYEHEIHREDIENEIDSMHGVSRPEKDWLSGKIEKILDSYERRLYRDDSWWYCLTAAINEIRGIY